jgi:hypothetical protein
MKQTHKLKSPPIDAASLIMAAAAIQQMENNSRYGEPKTLNEARVLISYLETKCEQLEQLMHMAKPAGRAARTWLTTTQAVKYAKDRGVSCTA